MHRELASPYDWSRRALLAGLVASGLSVQEALAAFKLTMVIPVKPGGGWDTTGRVLGRALQEVGADATVSYDNKGGGAAGTIGLAQFLTHNKSDPNTLLMMGAVMLGGLILDKSPVRLQHATPVARLTSEYNVIVLPRNSPFSSLDALVTQMRRDPGSVRWGGGSRGSTEHIAAAMLARALGVDPSRVNYVAFRGGGEATTAILEGHVAVGGSGWSELAEHVHSGRVKALAVTAPERLSGVEVPTLREQGLDVVIGNWRGVYGAPGITPAQTRRLVDLVQRATQTKSWAQALARYRWAPAVLTGAEFGQFVEDEFALMRSLLGSLGMA